jgi:hypothetical protein
MAVSHCPKCNASMVEGYTLDHGDYGSRSVTTWIEGKPEPSMWIGLKTGDRKNLPIATFRCSSCGFLEFYAKG